MAAALYYITPQTVSKWESGISEPDAEKLCAMRDEIREGDAELVCTLSDGVKTRYKISIVSINKSADGSKCFVIKIKDSTLIEKTGGIVQGMSGSPIIQNGKLIGARCLRSKLAMERSGI